MALFGKADAGLPFLTRFYQLVDDEKYEVQEFLRREIVDEEELRSGGVLMDFYLYPPGVINEVYPASLRVVKELLPLCRRLMDAKADHEPFSPLDIVSLEKIRSAWLAPLIFLSGATSRSPLVLWQKSPKFLTPLLEPITSEDAEEIYADYDEADSHVFDEHAMQFYIFDFPHDEEGAEALSRIQAALLDPVEYSTYAAMYAPFLVPLLDGLKSVATGNIAVSRCDECRSAFVARRGEPKYCSYRCNHRVALRNARAKT